MFALFTVRQRNSRRNQTGNDSSGCLLKTGQSRGRSGSSNIGPLMGATADQNYFETLKFVSQLSEASTSNPFGVRSLIERIRYVQPSVKENSSAKFTWQPIELRVSLPLHLTIQAARKPTGHLLLRLAASQRRSCPDPAGSRSSDHRSNHELRFELRIPPSPFPAPLI